jgi:hypothetical protein
MNYRIVLGSMFFWTCCSFFLSAQPMAYPASSQENFSKPSLFSRFPDKAECSMTSLRALFSNSTQVVLTLDNEIVIRGEIINRVSQNLAVQSVNIRLTDFPGALCTVSRISLGDGSVRFSGRILSVRHKDAMLLLQDKGTYYFIKTTQHLVMTE